MEQKKVVIAMSGGVDSSVAAALLVKAGYQVTGMMLRLWSECGEEENNRCCTPDAMAQARRVAAKIGIPFYAIDAKDRFRSTVVQYLLDGYRRGVTPNPCLECNRQIRWGLLLEHAREFGADYLATGHYTRLDRDETGRMILRKGVDPRKDQSYVLSVLDQQKLSHSLFPLGEYHKTEIREMAHELGLSVADRADSQDLCFVPDRDMARFLKANDPQIVQPGEIRDRQGNSLGQHSGLAFYTIGQRKGLGLADAEPYYVLEKDLATRTLVVGRKSELGRSHLTTGPANWIAGEAPRSAFEAEVKIRYRAEAARARVTPREDGGFDADFEEPLRDITAGQLAVAYQGDVVVGSGIIAP